MTFFIYVILSNHVKTEFMLYIHQFSESRSQISDLHSKKVFFEIARRIVWKDLAVFKYENKTI